MKRCRFRLVNAGGDKILVLFVGGKIVSGAHEPNIVTDSLT